jgi:putative oxidoreductase
MSSIAKAQDRPRGADFFAAGSLRNTTTKSVVLPSVTRLNAGLAILRIVIGIVFMAHGAQKIFTFGLAGVSEGMAGMGIPLAGIAGPAVAFTELLGGLALALGLFTRLAALGLSIVMLGAMLFVHLPAGFFLPNGYEFTLTLLAVNVAYILIGAGEYSLDAVVARRRSA